MKKLLSLLIAAALLFALCVPALADDDYGPFTIDSHYWSAKTFGYQGIFQFSAASFTLDATSSDRASYTEEYTVRLKPGSTVTVVNNGSGLVTPGYDAEITGFLPTGAKYWLPLKAGTYSAEDFFGAREFGQYTDVTDDGFRPGAGPLGPFDSFYLATVTMDQSSRIVTYAYTITLDSAAAPAGPTVVLSPQKLRVNTVPIDCEKYNIDGSNYFKLRDLAQLLNGTGSSFNVGWDAARGVVSITTGALYTEPNGTELLVGADMSATAQPSAQTIMIDGVVRSDLSVYNIGGSNFFKLRELGDALGFDVDYDAATDTAIVTSGRSAAPTPAAADSVSVSLTRRNHSYWTEDFGRTVFVNCYYDLPEISDAIPLKDKINAALRSDYEIFLASDLVGDLYAGGYDEGETNYFNGSPGEVTQNADGILSIAYGIDWWMGGVGDGSTYGVTVSLKTGELLRLSDLTAADGSAITFRRMEDIAVGYYTGYGLSRADLFLDTFEQAELDDLDFYIENNEIVLCIHKYELAFGAAGPAVIPTGICIVP